MDGTRFDGATFSGEAAFWSTTFSPDTSFKRAIFSGYAWFDEATFSAEIFSWRTGFDGVTFCGATFLGDAGFEKTTFSRRAAFDGVTFLRNARFHESNFSGGLNLEYTSFGILGDFDKCFISDYIRTTWPGEGTKRDEKQQEVKRGTLQFKELKFKKNGVLDLRNNSLQEDSKLIFHSCDMSQILLEGTDCTNVVLYNCTWPTIHNRRVVGDEYLKWKCKHPSLNNKYDEKAQWSRIAITYQQLAKSFREKFDHPTANDFDLGIYEMRRRIAFQRGDFRGLSDFFLISGHKWLSNYGRSLLRPLLWLLVSIPLFAFAYWSTSINAEVDPFFWNAWKISVQIASLIQIGLKVVPDNFAWVDISAFLRGNRIWVYILVAFQVICTATPVALFLFAIRRRFKH